MGEQNLGADKVVDCTRGNIRELYADCPFDVVIDSNGGGYRDSLQDLSACMPTVSPLIHEPQDVKVPPIKVPPVLGAGHSPPPSPAHMHALGNI